MNMDVFNEIEKKYNLLDKNIYGYNFWTYSRFRIAWLFEQNRKHLGNAHAGKKTTFSNRLQNEVKRFKNILSRGKIPDKCCDLLVLNHSRRVLVDDLYECIYTDEIVENYPNTVVLEENYQGIHYQPTRTFQKKLIYTDYVELKSFWYCVFQQRFFPKKFSNIKDQIRNEIKEPLEELNLICKTNVSVESIVTEMLYGYFMYQVERHYYKKILDKLKPKAVLEVVSYSRRCMVVNELAKEMDIPTIELQHGTAGKEHGAYNYPEGSKVKQFPDYIFLFSKYWNNEGTRFPVPYENRKAVGYPYLEKMAEKYSFHRNTTRNKRNILFLSSGPIGDKLSKIAVELTKKLDMNTYHIIYKLHPGEYAVWREIYPELMNSSVEVIDNNCTNLYELYSLSDIQISGYNSTTVFEGLYFELETYILDYCVSKEIADLCERGIAAYFRTAEELAEKIQNTKKDDMESGIAFWEKNGLHNILRELEIIAKK